MARQTCPALHPTATAWATFILGVSALKHLEPIVSLYQPRVTSIIFGAKRVDQLEDNLGAVNIVLTDDDLQILAAVSANPPEYPGWMFDIWSAFHALLAAAMPGSGRSS